MLRQIKSSLFIFCFVAALQISGFSQRKHSKIHNGWKDTTGTADLEQARKQFWDSMPDPTGLTTDFENIFTTKEKNHLDSMILNFEKRTSIEFCIVTLDTMKVNMERFGELPAYIEKAWGIGKKETKNGIVICLSVGYRAIRIGAGSGIADYISDKETTAFITKNFLPDFKKGKYYDGTLNGLTAIIGLLDNRLKGKTSASR